MRLTSVGIKKLLKMKKCGRIKIPYGSMECLKLCGQMQQLTNPPATLKFGWTDLQTRWKSKDEA